MPCRERCGEASDVRKYEIQVTEMRQKLGDRVVFSKRTFYFWNAVITTAAVTFLFWLIYFREGSGQSNLAVGILPAINATLNAICAILLAAAFVAIKSRREILHRNLMITAFCVSTIFLVSYVYYHSLQGDTKFLGVGWVRPVYFSILISHIVLSILMLPMILSSLFFGLANKRAIHRKISRFTLPVWLYVSITGVVIFFMLRAYS